MNLRLRTMTWTLALAAATAGAAPAQVAAPQPWSILRGSFSGIQDARQIVVKDEETWKALWSEHARGTAKENTPPTVDFRREMVVAVFAGLQNEAYPVELDFTRDPDSGALVAQYRVKREGVHAEAISQPWIMKKVARAPSIRFFDAPGRAGSVAVARGQGDAVAPPDTGVHDAVSSVSAKLRAQVGAQTARSFAAIFPQSLGELKPGESATGAAGNLVLVQAPPPGADTTRGRKPLPSDGTLGEPQERGRKPLPGDGTPPPATDGQDGQQPPSGPVYRSRPTEPGLMPPPPASGVGQDDSPVTTTGHWQEYRDYFGNPEERYGEWQNELDQQRIDRGGAETGVSQDTRYVKDFASRPYRRRYVLYWRWVGVNCNPQDPDRCERWERDWHWFYENDLYGRERRMTVTVNFDLDRTLLPWERERFELSFDGAQVSVRPADAAFHYDARGPIVDQQHGTAVVTLTPTSRILRAPEREKVAARLENQGGRLKLIIEDARASFYAGEPLEIQAQVKRNDPWTWRHPFKRDPVMFERTDNGPERVTTDPSNPKTVIDLSISASAEYYLDNWSFRRAQSKVSSGDWMRRGSGNRVKL